MGLEIRYGTREDAVLIADISHETFYATFASANTPEDMEIFLKQQFTKGKLMLEVGAPGNDFLLAYHDGRIAGYAKIRDGKLPLLLGSQNALELARLYAMPDMIGKGVGAALMEACIRIAKERAKDTIWLGVWEKNERAIRFYSSWGFEKFADTDFLLGNDSQNDWLMSKKL